MFHPDCISYWQCFNSTCPVCKAKISNKRQFLSTAGAPIIATTKFDNKDDEMGKINFTNNQIDK
jgi:hypothetical protein